VVIQRPAADISRTVLLNRVWIIVAGLIAGAGAIVTFYWITQRVILRPIRQLRAIANNVAEGNLDIRSAIKTGDEYEKLANAFNHMLDGLQAAQEKLRQANKQLDDKIAELSERNIELVKPYSSLVITKTVSMPATALLVIASLNSYCTSVRLRRPRRMALAFFLAAYSTVSPSKLSTETPGMSATSSAIISTRSSGVKSGFLIGLRPTAMISSSKSFMPRLMTSRCPFVIGSNVPGKITLTNFLAISAPAFHNKIVNAKAAEVKYYVAALKDSAVSLSRFWSFGLASVLLC